jgi:hypothetical protein
LAPIKHESRRIGAVYDGIIVPTINKSELFDRGFRLQQDWNAVANGIDPFALVALKSVFPTHDEGLAAYGAGEYLQQLWADHDSDFSRSGVQLLF